MYRWLTRPTSTGGLVLHARTSGLILAVAAAVAVRRGVLKPHSESGLHDIASRVGRHACRPSQ